MTNDAGDPATDVTNDASQQPRQDGVKPKPASPYWWLVMLGIGGAAGELTAITGSPFWMLAGGVGMVAVYRKLTAHNVQPKALKRVKPKTLSRK